MLRKKRLELLYYKKNKSLTEIASILHCSINKVVYWMEKHDIIRRSISDAVYVKNNPNGDPFKLHMPQTLEASMLYGLGLGLYWGEGTKANLHSVRLGNSDPQLIVSFISFLERVFEIKKSDLKFSLQIFSDVDPRRALNHWVKALNVRRSQFTKSTISISNKIGTYRKKNLRGVVTLYYHNKKLRDLIMSLLQNIK